MAKIQQDYLADSEAEENFPLFTPHEMPYLRDERDRATKDQHDATELDLEPETDTALFEETREAHQSFQTSSQSLDQSQSETD